MATIKVFDSKGVRELKCFNTLEFVPYVEDEPIENDYIVESDASDDSVDF